VVFGSKSAAMCLAVGKNSASTSWRLASRSAASRLTPVVLPPGRESDRASPEPTMSSVDKAVISRRVAAALDAGFLRNLEDRKGRPARLVLGDELPADSDVLPTADKLDGHEVLRGCAGVQGGIHPPPLPCSSALEEDVRPGVCAQCKANGPTLLYPDPSLPHDGVWLHKECAQYRASRGIT
jgi:hypothetical protein